METTLFYYVLYRSMAAAAVAYPFDLLQCLCVFTEYMCLYR